MNRYFLLILPVIFVLSIIGCNKSDNPTEPETTSGPSAGQPMPSFDNSADYGGTLATIQYSMASPIAGFPAIQTTLVFGILGKGVDGGALTVNNNSIGKLTQGGSTYYLVPNPSNPTQTVSGINFNGSSHNFAISGGNGIPAFNGAVSSPASFNVTAPVANASISKSSNLQVTWGGGSSSKVLVQIISTSDSKVKSYQELNDTGSHTIPSADLSSFGGDCMVYVVKYNYNVVTGGGKKYYLISEIVKNVVIKIN